MLFFGKKKIEVYSSRNEKEFKSLKKLLKANNIKFSTSWVQTEIACGCGAKINIKKVINKSYSPFVWYIFVKEEDVENAKKMIETYCKENTKI